MIVKLVAFAAFVATVWAANWALKEYGTVPVWPGLDAPAGVYFAGLGFLLRDLLHELGGRLWVVAGILAGAALSYWLGADVTLGGYVPLAVASAAAFLASELADFAVYTPLRERNLPAAVASSQLVGGVVDSVLFLVLAFGSLSLLTGQIVGKTLMVVPVVVVLFALRRTRVVTA